MGRILKSQIESLEKTPQSDMGYKAILLHSTGDKARNGDDGNSTDEEALPSDDEDKRGRGGNDGDNYYGYSLESIIRDEVIAVIS